MRFLFIILIFCLVSAGFANSMDGDKKSGPKVINMNGKTIDSGIQSRTPAAGGDVPSPEDMAEIMKKLKDYKQYKDEENKYLEELVNED